MYMALGAIFIKPSEKSFTNIETFLKFRKKRTRALRIAQNQ